jgi:hypothetical protein
MNCEGIDKFWLTIEQAKLELGNKTVCHIWYGAYQ